MIKRTPTPGPWKVLHRPPSLFGLETYEILGNVLSVDTGTPAVVAGIRYYNSGFNQPGLKAEADAHLIAAAPELLEMVKAMNYAFYTKGTKKALLEVMKESKTLIAKAEGETDD